MNFENIKCQIKNHQKQIITFVCVSQFCSCLQKFGCHSCLLSHSTHIHELVSYDEFSSKVKFKFDKVSNEMRTQNPRLWKQNHQQQLNQQLDKMFEELMKRAINQILKMKKMIFHQMQNIAKTLSEDRMLYKMEFQEYKENILKLSGKTPSQWNLPEWKFLIKIFLEDSNPLVDYFEGEKNLANQVQIQIQEILFSLQIQWEQQFQSLQIETENLIFGDHKLREEQKVDSLNLDSVAGEEKLDTSQINIKYKDEEFPSFDDEEIINKEDLEQNSLKQQNTEEQNNNIQVTPLEIDLQLSQIKKFLEKASFLQKNQKNKPDSLLIKLDESQILQEEGKKRKLDDFLHQILQEKFTNTLYNQYSKIFLLNTKLQEQIEKKEATPSDLIFYLWKFKLVNWMFANKISLARNIQLQEFSIDRNTTSLVAVSKRISSFLEKQQFPYFYLIHNSNFEKIQGSWFIICQNEKVKNSNPYSKYFQSFKENIYRVFFIVAKKKQNIDFVRYHEQQFQNFCISLFGKNMISPRILSDCKILEWNEIFHSGIIQKSFSDQIRSLIELSCQVICENNIPLNTDDFCQVFLSLITNFGDFIAAVYKVWFLTQ